MAMLNDLSVDNSGKNTGIIVGKNSGTINYLHQVVKLSSLIAAIIKEICMFCYDDIDEESSDCDFTPFSPDDKLDYNCVIKYKEIIKEYSMYYEKCDKILNIYDNSCGESKKKILKCVSLWYKKSKGTLLVNLRNNDMNEIDKIRNNSDQLIDDVSDKIKHVVENSESFSDISSEELDLAIACFVCYCFMKCKILEKPKALVRSI